MTRHILLCCHGSRDQRSIEASLNLSRELAKRFSPIPLSCAFLEFASPNIPDELERLAAGVRRLDILPLMLGAAGHVKNDIAWLVRTFKERTALDVRMARDLGLSSSMLSLAHLRIKEALAGVDPSQSSLLVVGRGTSDPDANGDIGKLTRMLQESFGFPAAMTAYAGVAHPRVDVGLRHLAHLPYKNIVVFPYLLFTGVLVARITQQCEDFRQETGRTVVQTNYLGVHSHVLDCLEERVKELEEEKENLMNCSLCKYREVIPGFEKDLKQAQHAHHFHHQSDA